MQNADCTMQYIFTYSHWLIVSRHSSVDASYHSLANRHSCSTPAETQDRKCFSMQLILVVGKVDIWCYHFVESYCQLMLLKKMITKYITKYSSNCKVCMY